MPEFLKRRIKDRLGVRSVERCMHKLRQWGFRPRKAIDVGAYAGEWTQLCRACFPDCSVLMIEPMSHMQSGLQKMLGPGIQLECCLLGAESAHEVAFHEKETASSVLAEPEAETGSVVHYPMSTLDAVVEKHGWQSVNFLKLDVQGYELEVLRGGESAVREAEVILMEMNLIPIYQGAPLIDQLIPFMAKRGFRLADVCSFYERPLDGALWQMDGLFVRNDSSLAGGQRWQ